MLSSEQVEEEDEDSEREVDDFLGVDLLLLLLLLVEELVFLELLLELFDLFNFLIKRYIAFVFLRMVVESIEKITSTMALSPKRTAKSLCKLRSS